MAWRAARSLLTLHAQLKREAPRAAPPATDPNAWGLLGDAAHDPTSDHAPHDFPGWGDDIVTAADFPNAPALGLDAHAVLDSIRRSRDPRAKYGISNGQIFSNHAVSQGGQAYAAYEWRPYRRADGSRYADEHYTHGHLSVVGDARADGTQPWATGLTGGNDIMGTLDGIQAVQLSNAEAMLGALRDLSDTIVLNPGDNKPRAFPSALASTIKAMAADARAGRVAVEALRVVVEQLAAAITAGGGTVDTAAILAGVDSRLAALRAELDAEVRDAVADLGEGGAAQVRADA